MEAHRSLVPRSVLGSMVGALLPRFPVLDAPTLERVERDVSQFVARQVGALPTALRIPFGLAALGFDLLPILYRGRPFSRLSAASQSTYLALWSDAPLAPMRNVIRLVRSCTLLAFYDHPAVASELRAGASTRPAPPKVSRESR